MDTISIISLVASIVSLVLGIVAIALSFASERRSRESYEKTRDALDKISTMSAVIETTVKDNQTRLLDTLSEIANPKAPSLQDQATAAIIQGLLQNAGGAEQLLKFAERAQKSQK
jgi:hypothetical protein